MLFLQAMLALTLQTGAASDALHASAKILSSADFPTSERLMVSRRLPVALHLTQEEAASIIPFRSEFGIADFSCTTVNADGSFGGCTTEVEPKGVGYEEAAAHLINRMSADPVLAAQSANDRKHVSIQVRMEHFNAPVRSGPCVPPNCWGVLAAPPPPPAQNTSTAAE